MEMEVFSGARFLFLFTRWFCFQRLVLLSVRELLVSQHHLINAISVEEERGRRSNLRRRSRRAFWSRLGTGRYAARSKMFWPRCFLRRVLLSVPLELY